MSMYTVHKNIAKTIGYVKLYENNVNFPQVYCWNIKLT